MSWTATTAETGSIVWRVLDGDGDEVRRTDRLERPPVPATITWDGKDDAGTSSPTASTTSGSPARRGGNTGAAVDRTVRVATTLGFVTSSKTLFYPQDDDRFARTTTLASP